MPNYVDIVQKDNKTNLQSIKETIEHRKRTDWFWPNGIQIYSGRQGCGKTISLVYHLYKLKKQYPKAIVVTNLKINFPDSIKKGVRYTNAHELTTIVRAYNTGKLQPDLHYIRFTNASELQDAFVHVNNTHLGVIYAIDEIHLYYNSLTSRSVPIAVMTEVSQQRKQRKLILGTSQLFSRMAKPFREQADNIILCKTYFGLFTRQSIFDAESLVADSSGNMSGRRIKLGWFQHTPELRDSFDTYQKVIDSHDQLPQTEEYQEFPFLEKKPRGYKKFK